jgi:hypothetical protein
MMMMMMMMMMSGSHLSGSVYETAGMLFVDLKMLVRPVNT